MSLPLKTLREQKIDEVMQSLQRARDLVRSREEFGVDGIDNFVQNVDGDWLECWSSESSSSLPEKKNRKSRPSLLMALAFSVASKGDKFNYPKMSMELMV